MLLLLIERIGGSMVNGRNQSGAENAKISLGHSVVSASTETRARGLSQKNRKGRVKGLPSARDERA